MLRPSMPVAFADEEVSAVPRCLPWLSADGVCAVAGDHAREWRGQGGARPVRLRGGGLRIRPWRKSTRSKLPSGSGGLRSCLCPDYCKYMQAW